MAKDFNHSYWEIKRYFQVYDLIVIGSGIVGISSALSFREKFKKAKILILERGIFPDGASTKNAGFACFGSSGELLNDLNTTPQEIVWETVMMRWQGLAMLRERLGDKALHYKSYGNFELFLHENTFEHVQQRLPILNAAIEEHLGLRKCFTVEDPGAFNFKKTKGIIKNKYEGQLDTGEMMRSLVRLARKNDIEILYNITVSEISDGVSEVKINTNAGVFKARKCVVAVNGFAAQLLKMPDVLPARAQVLITDEIPGLQIKGAFHFDEGFYYFRNINKRILFGGGRNSDFKKETTISAALNPKIQNSLEKILREIILPDKQVNIAHRWTGIMGIGPDKKPIIKSISKNTVAAVRMGGMGIAIGSLVGKKAADLILKT